MCRRDDFTAAIKDTLAKRVAYLCSNPGCRQPTIGPAVEEMATVSIGVAAHITAAAPGGPRFNAELDPNERAGIQNGIWLCQTCSRLIDRDVNRYTKQVVDEWKATAEREAQEALERRTAALTSRRWNVAKVRSLAEMRAALLPIVEENASIRFNYGPNSELHDEAPVRWDLRLWYQAREEIILPNNDCILALLDLNLELVPAQYRESIKRLRLHVYAFKKHCANRDFDYSAFQYPCDFSEFVKGVRDVPG